LHSENDRILAVPRIGGSEIGQSENGRSEIGCLEIGRSDTGRCTSNYYYLLWSSCPTVRDKTLFSNYTFSGNQSPAEVLLPYPFRLKNRTVPHSFALA
jgi:hypothetical protein